MSISATVDDYLRKQPVLQESIAEDVANLSKLARKIIVETNLEEKDFDAALVALRRKKELFTKRKNYKKKIQQLLKKTTMEIKTNIAVIITEKTTFYEKLLAVQKHIKEQKGTTHIIEGKETITIITQEIYTDFIKKHYKHHIIKERTGLVEVIMTSPETLEEVPGVIQHLYSLLASKHINVVETVSCWKDTIIVVEKKDLQAVTELFDF